MLSLLEGTRQALGRALRAAWRDGGLPEPPELPDPAIVLPREAAHGDLASNWALVMAGPAKRSPRSIAAVLAARLDRGAVPHLEDVEVAGPGFLNFRLGPGWLPPVVADVLAAGDAYGQSDAGQGERVLVEFVSANPTGPLNVVNARAAAFGDALVRCLRRAGFRAEAEFYVNDAGQQFNKLALSVRARVRGEPVPEGGYPGAYLAPLAEAFRAAHPGPEEPPLEAYGRFAVERILGEQRALLDRYRVHFDQFWHESTVRADRGPERVVEALRAGGLTYDKDEAIWLRSRDFGDNDDRVLVKRDGEFTYLVPDLAYHDGKFDRGFARLIDIWGQDHHGHVLPMKAGLAALGRDPARLEVLLTQMVRLLRGGEAVKISKRGGTFVGLDEFLDEVGVDAARYFFLLRTLDSHFDFDLDLAVRQAADNPVYYVQYAHARIASILRQAGAGGPAAGAGDAALLVHPAERDLCLALAQFPDEVVAAAASRGPHRLTVYARTLAERFHRFYGDCRVLGDDPALSAARLDLCRATRQVLANSLELLGVSAPERM